MEGGAELMQLAFVYPSIRMIKNKEIKLKKKIKPQSIVMAGCSEEENSNREQL